jgi:hypothetical protein
MMLSPLAIDAVCEKTPLRAADFYRESHGHIFRAVLALHAKREPVDAITVVDELDRHERSSRPADRPRPRARVDRPRSGERRPLRPHRRRDGTLRALIRAGNDIARSASTDPAKRSSSSAAPKGSSRRSPTSAHRETRTALARAGDPRTDPRHAEYVDGVLEAGVLADIVGLPYLHKSASRSSSPSRSRKAAASSSASTRSSSRRRSRTSGPTTHARKS